MEEIESNYDYVVSVFILYVFIDDLNCERYPHLCVVIVGDLLSPLSYHGGQGERERWKMCVANDFYFSWDLSSHFSPRR